ncbi:MAG: zinc-finger domain-containing protein [Rickettsiales bacterium]|nr:zinc-finger domain-containing protein [Rickettsiales bacterium]
MKKTDIVETESPKVSCSGGEGSLGHPLVYLDMGDDDQIVCPYCSRVFVLKKKIASGE